MQTVRGEDKIAVLLTSLPRAAAESVLARLGPQRGARLRELMARAGSEVSPDVMSQVLREFEESVRQAAGGSNRLRLAYGTTAEDENEPHSKSNSGDDRYEATDPDGSRIDDPIAELQQIDSERLAEALKGEHPRGVATVLSCLDAGKACEVLKRLPPETRREVFPRLAHGASGGDDVVLRIVRAVVAKTRTKTEEPIQVAGDSRAQMMADMLKAMEQADRMELLNVVEDQDNGLAAAIREKLYVFEDLLVIADRSLQKLLAEIDAKTLAMAMKDAPTAIIEKILNNLSKRARETLTEERGYLSDLPSAQVHQARKSIVDVIQRLDQAGELVMIR